MNPQTKAAYNSLHTDVLGYSLIRIRKDSIWLSQDQAVMQSSGLGSALEQRRSRKARARSLEKARRASRARNR